MAARRVTRAFARAAVAGAGAGLALAALTAPAAMAASPGDGTPPSPLSGLSGEPGGTLVQAVVDHVLINVLNS
ncbi:hypothetical protein [Thermocatellispora tengchongensis]